jgi:hypothetical protein
MKFVASSVICGVVILVSLTGGRGAGGRTLGVVDTDTVTVLVSRTSTRINTATVNVTIERAPTTYETVRVTLRLTMRVFLAKLISCPISAEFKKNPAMEVKK